MSSKDLKKGKDLEEFFNLESFIKSHKNNGNSRAKEIPMATPSICWYMKLSKLNSTDLVALHTSQQNMSLKKLGGVKLLLYIASVQILIISSSVTLVNKLLMSKEQTKVGSGLRSWLV